MANGLSQLAQSMAPDILGSFERGRAQARQQQREQFADEELRARVSRENRFRELAGAAYGAAPVDRQQILSQAAAADPQGAMALDQQMGVGEDRKQQRLGVWARALTQIPESNVEMRSALYQRMRPEMMQFGIDAPEQYTPEVGQMAEAFMSMAGGASGVQSTVIGNDGQFYLIMRNGQTVPTGRFAAPNVRVMEQEGQVPYGVVTGRGAAGQVVPFGAPGAQSAPPPASAALPAGPAAAPPAAAPAPPGAVASGTPAPGPVRIPTAAETAADKARAEAAVQLQTGPRIAEETAAAKARGEAAGERDTKAINANTMLDMVELAEPLIDVASGSAGAAARDRVARFFGKATSGAEAIAELQVLEAALMTNMPRMEGPQSDRDVELYRQAAGNLGDPTVPAPIKKASLRQIKLLQQRYVKRGSQPQSATQANAPAAGAQPANVVDWDSLQ